MEWMDNAHWPHTLTNMPVSGSEILICEKHFSDEEPWLNEASQNTFWSIDLLMPVWKTQKTHSLNLQDHSKVG